MFHGRVADYHRESGYRVMYEDGDVEDLKRDALLVLLDKTARMKKEMDKHSKPRAAAVAAAVAAAGDDGSAWVPPPPPLNPSAAGGSRTLAEFVKRARDASRRKRKHTDLTVKSAERARLKPPPPPKRVLEEEEVRLPMPKPPTWALGMPRDPRYIRVDADSAWGPTPRLRDEAGLFQLSLFWESPIAVAVSWTFPPANPGDASAWVGLFPAVCVAWHDQYGEVSSGAAKLGYRTLTQNQSRGTVCFRRLIETAPDGEYVFTLQRDYGVRCEDSQAGIGRARPSAAVAGTAKPLSSNTFNSPASDPSCSLRHPSPPPPPPCLPPAPTHEFAQLHARRPIHSPSHQPPPRALSASSERPPLHLPQVLCRLRSLPDPRRPSGRMLRRHRARHRSR